MSISEKAVTAPMLPTIADEETAASFDNVSARRVIISSCETVTAVSKKKLEGTNSLVKIWRKANQTQE